MSNDGLIESITQVIMVDDLDSFKTDDLLANVVRAMSDKEDDFFRMVERLAKMNSGQAKLEFNGEYFELGINFDDCAIVGEFVYPSLNHSLHSSELLEDSRRRMPILREKYRDVIASLVGINDARMDTIKRNAQKRVDVFLGLMAVYDDKVRA